MARAKAKVVPVVDPRGPELSGELEVSLKQRVGLPAQDSAEVRSTARARHSVSLSGRARLRLRHSGRAALLAALAAAAPLCAQSGPQLELDLRSGRRVLAEQLLGSPAGGYEARAGGQVTRIAHKDLLAIRLGPARAPELLRVELVGGERLYGAIAGGDQNGDALELLSPVLGERSVPIDRLQALVQPGVHLGDQVVPDGVDEALFVPTRRGYDLVAGTLFRFGARGVQFQAEGREQAQWYGARAFSSVQLRGGLDREEPAACTLWTRSADRVGVALGRCTEAGVEVTFETGAATTVRWLDVACVVFDHGVTHLSSLEPEEVVERGYSGAPVLRWQRDRSVVGDELIAQGRAYGRGLGVHSMSRLTYVVPAGATHFRARVAFDDSAAALPLRARAAARVLRDGRQVFEAPDLEPGQPPRDVGLQVVEPGEKITLEVDYGDGRDLGDRVDWLLPVFLMRSGS